MKKPLIGLIALIIIAPTVQAATIYSMGGNIFHYNEVNFIQPITITAEKEDEITAKNGIRILIDPVQPILWDAVEKIELTGSAASQGYINENIKPVFSANYKEVFIPILKNWTVNLRSTIYGLKFRAYQDPVPFNYYLGLDFTGDGIADVYDSYAYTIEETTPWADLTPPYKPTDVKAVVSLNPAKVVLSWVRPPDYDYEGIRVIKTLVRNGRTEIDQQMILNKYKENDYEDTKVQEGDEIKYEIAANDVMGASEPVVITVKLIQDIIQEPTPPPAEPVVVDDAELTQLSSLYNYYKTRFGIKCREGVSAGDSACLWSKIDVVYAQILLGNSDLNISLTARDLELMALRIVWPEKRYQTNCINVQTPDKTCPALEKSLKRAHYFIDK